MLKLPLFPLNTVLFPGMLLPLHIFEPRYQEMVNDCLNAREPFGIVLIQAGPEVGGTAEPCPIGTYGHISRVERLPDGRMNIEIIGQERFRIRQLHHDKAYLSGTVETFPLIEQKGASVQDAANLLMPVITRYLKLLGQAAETSFDTQQLPNDPAALAYLAAIVLQAPMEEKQQLLSLASTVELLSAERQLYRREISLLRVMLNNPQSKHDPMVSPN